MAGLLPAACQGGDPERGARLFQERGCHDCHAARTVPYHGPQPNPSRGPDLVAVRGKYRRQELIHWLNDPEGVYREQGRRPLNPGYPPMPQVTLNREELEDLLAFLARQ